jgi:hypothetical protein
MTVDELRKELETIVSDLSTSGFSNIDSGILEKLNKIAIAADETGMKEGKRIIENLSTTIKAIKEGTSKEESGNVRLTALDFYVKNIPDSANIEDL